MEDLIQHLDSLYNFALRLTGDRAEAHDLTQQACLTAIKKANQLRDKKRLKAWVFRILRNLFYESLRGKDREPPMVSIDEPAAENLLLNSVLKPVNLDNPSHRPLSQEVEQALASLPHDMRMALLLADIEGFHYEEIADIMGCPVGTIRSRLARGRERLSRKLLSYAEEEGFFSRGKTK